MSTSHAKFGAAAYLDLKGKLPSPFPRVMGKNAGKYVQEVVDSGLTADMIGRFETTFAAMMGMKHCIMGPGCTPSMAMVFESLRYDPGDEIICSPITDYGTIFGVLRANLIPVFADTDANHVNISAATIEPLISNRTRAILCVHKTGIPCDMDPINALAKKHGLRVIEDCCQAVLGRYKGRYVGTLGDFGCFSFDSEKTLGGDRGGCVVTNDDQLADYMRFRCQSRGGIEVQGFGRTHVEAGCATRASECTAAICLAQLEIMPDHVAHIDRIARALTRRLGEIPGIEPLALPEEMDVYSCWMFGFAIDPAAFSCDADTFADACAQAGIPGAGTARYYLMPEACRFLKEIVEQGVFPFSTPPARRAFVYDQTTCPNAHAYLDRWVRWTSFCEKYQDEHVDVAARIVQDVANRFRR